MPVVVRGTPRRIPLPIKHLQKSVSVTNLRLVSVTNLRGTNLRAEVIVRDTARSRPAGWRL